MGKLLQLKKSPANRAAIIDEFGDVALRRAEFTPVERRYDQLRAEIASWYADKPADEDFVEKGGRYELRISQKSLQTKVDIKAAHKRLGLAKFLSVCAVTMKALEKFLAKPEIEALTVSERTGYRSYVPTPLGTPPAEKEPAA